MKIKHEKLKAEINFLKRKTNKINMKSTIRSSSTSSIHTDTSYEEELKEDIQNDLFVNPIGSKRKA